jgi:hypothetical protein
VSVVARAVVSVVARAVERAVESAVEWIAVKAELRAQWS